MTALPVRSEYSTRTSGLQTGGSQECEDISVELRVPVQNLVTTWAKGDSRPSCRNGPSSVPNVLSNKGEKRRESKDKLYKLKGLQAVALVAFDLTIFLGEPSFWIVWIAESGVEPAGPRH